MDYGSFYPQQQQQQTYPNNLTAANLQNLQTNNTAFQINPSPPTLTQPTADQCPNHQNNNISPLQQSNISPLQQQQQNNIAPLQAGNLAQLQTNMFYMDPFDPKPDAAAQTNDFDHASYSSWGGGAPPARPAREKL